VHKHKDRQSRAVLLFSKVEDKNTRTRLQPQSYVSCPVMPYHYVPVNQHTVWLCGGMLRMMVVTL